MATLVQTRFGRMLVNEKDTYVGRSLLEYGEFSMGEAHLFADIIRPGWCVADIGANIGAHTLQFSRLVGPEGRVYAFEPQRLIFQTLCANVALNNLRNVFCEQAAIGERKETVSVLEANPDIPQNFGGISLSELQNANGDAIEIKLLRYPCHFLKIDVEGMEVEVLKGASSMIKERKPLMYVENDRDARSEELIDTIESLGYTPFWHVTPLFNPHNFNKKVDNIWGNNVVSFNLVCIPHGLRVNHDLDRAKESSTDYSQKLAKRIA